MLEYERRLSATDRRVINQRFQSLQTRERYSIALGLGKINIKADVEDFARRLGATNDEIEFDVLPSLGFSEPLESPFKLSPSVPPRSLLRRIFHIR